MPAYDLTEINRRIKEEPREFVRESDALLRQSVLVAAESIKIHMKTCPIVLLAGPSGSGKTTVAKMIEEELEEQGVSTVTVSMDNYFKTVDPDSAPRTPEGDIDFESPECLDMELLNEHFTALSRGERIRIPFFIFSRQKRSASQFTPLRLRNNEVVIFEGIHALNDAITDAHPEAFKLYISASSDFIKDGRKFFDSRWLRLVRRVVRDDNFRGSSAAFTLKLWANVLRGEELYINPYVHKVNIALDSTLPYEVSLLKRFAEPLFRAVPEATPQREQMENILEAFQFFEELNPSLVGPNSLLREFIGGSAYDTDIEEEK